MSSFRDLVRKVNAGEKTVTSNEQEQSVAAEKENGKSSFRNLVKKVNDGTIKVPTKLDYSGVDSWYKSADDVSKRVYDYYSKEGYKAPNSEFLSEIDTYLKNADDVAHYLRANKSKLEDFNSAITSHYDTVNYLRSLQSYVKKNNNYYSVYDDEEDYFRSATENWEERQKRYEENQAAIAKLEGEKDGFGFVFPWLDSDWSRANEIDDEIERLETENRLYERGEGGYVNKTVDDHFYITQNADFGTVSANRDYTNPTMDEYAQIPAYNDQNKWYYDENGVYRDAYGNALETDEFGNWIDPRNKDWVVEDKLGLYLNATEEQRNRAAAGDWGINNVSAAFREGLEGDWTYLTEQEVGIYYYYLAQSQEKAYQYLTDMEQELDRRRTMADLERWEDEYEQADDLEKVWMNLETVPANLVGSFGAFVSDTVDTLQGEEINPYSTAHTLSHYTRTVRGATAEELDDAKILGDFFTLGDLYQSGMSMVDSLAAMGVGGQFGSVLLAMGAAENEAYRLYQQGASKEQIAFGAAAAGATEMIFESLSLGNLDKIKNMASPKSLGQWFKTLLVQGGVEASEEMLTEITNTVANAFIMGSQSDWQKLMDENDGNLLSALQDKTLDVLHSGLGGFFSGGGSGAIVGGSSYANYVKERNANAKQTYGDASEALVGEALEIDPANAFAQKMQDRIGKGKQLTGGQLSRLAEQNESAILTQDKAAIQQAAQARLTELGESKKTVSELAAVLAKQAAGENLSHAEKRLIAKSRYGQRVANEMDPANIRAGTTNSAWAQNIGTERINAAEYNSAPVNAVANQGSQSEQQRLLRREELSQNLQTLKKQLKEQEDKLAKKQAREVSAGWLRDDTKQVAVLKKLVEHTQNELHEVDAFYEIPSDINSTAPNVFPYRGYSMEREALDNSKDSAIMGSSSQHGAYTDITDPLSKKRNAIAADYYEQVRNRDRTYEIAAVARNTGFSKIDVDKIFAHIFEKEHLFEDGEYRRFHPDYYMQHSWMRLREGKNVQNHDLTLLYHELAEATLMESDPSITYEQAHEEASKKFNYLKDLLEYLKYHDV